MRICTVENCGRVHYAKGVCSKHYLRRLHGWGDSPRQVRPMAERFWEKVAKTPTCWLWLGSVVNGYGRFAKVAKHRSSSDKAHRVSYELLVGPIPPGLEIDHLCRNRRCVNPAHLEPVSRRINWARGESPSYVNAKKVACVRGHRYDAANTWKSPSDGYRRCRACAREYQARRRAMAAQA